MSALAPARVGWCPGALRPMASGDGLILRLKPWGAAFSLSQARRIAEVSARFGNGALDLTSHANLQLRGMRDDSLTSALDALDDVGLIDPDPAAEAVRNVVSSPLAGYDPSAALDIRPIVAALERRLAEDDALHRLPAKFRIVIDDGGSPGLGDVAADLRFEASLLTGRPVFVIGLGGGDGTEALCDPSRVVETAAALAGLFIAARAVDPDLRRMRDFVRRDGADTILVRARLATIRHSLRRKEGRDAGLDDRTVLRIAAPFGRMSAPQLDTVARVAARAGAPDIRMTPWRAMLLPALSENATSEAARACAAAGLIVGADDPRLSVAACPGAPGCHRGSTPVRDHAARLAPWFGAASRRDGIALHVSGCGKGCAHAGRAPITFVAREGRYDIVIDGRASDAPLFKGLLFDEAQRCLAALIEGKSAS